MKGKTPKGTPPSRTSVTVRVGEMEKKHLQEQASMAGLSVSEYLRRRFFGSKPIVAHSDVKTIRELRRIGGLLKHNFETLRQAKATKECLNAQEETLYLLQATIDRLGRSQA